MSKKVIQIVQKIIIIKKLNQKRKKHLKYYS